MQWIDQNFMEDTDMTLHIAICDDDTALCDKIEDFIAKYSETSTTAIETEVFYSGEKLCEFCKAECEFDLIFLDIVMAEMTGIEVGRLIRKEMKNRKVPIAYMSSLDWNAVEFSRIQPFRFFKKPLTYKDVKECLDEYFEEYGDDEMYFECIIGKIARSVAVNSIVFFESRNKKIRIKTLQGELEFYGKLSDVQKEPFAKSFITIHKSLFVNTKQISEYQFEQLRMKDGSVLRISRSNQREVRNRLLLK
jgi:DNA-binding LytR/AlgR family response regulator